VDEDFETVLDNLEAQGHDMSAMREMNKALAELPVGDPTPAPGTLLREPTLVLPPALHEGLNEVPEGKFYLPPFSHRPGHHYNVGDLAKRLFRTRVWLALLTMYAISVTVVAVVNW
jgi:hypothetical protein